MGDCDHIIVTLEESLKECPLEYDLQQSLSFTRDAPTSLLSSSTPQSKMELMIMIAGSNEHNKEYLLI